MCVCVCVEKTGYGLQWNFVEEDHFRTFIMVCCNANVLIWAPSLSLSLPPSFSLSSLSIAQGVGLNELQIAFVCRETLQVHATT